MVENLARARRRIVGTHARLADKEDERTANLRRELRERMRAQEALKESERALRDRVAELEFAQRRLEAQGADLTRLAKDLALARDQAKAASRAKSEFLALISHELRTPLNAINGFSELIAMEAFGPVGNERYSEYAKDILGSGKHLLNLINNILDLSKIESGIDDLYEEDIEIHDLVRSVMTLVRPRAETGRIEVGAEIADEIPALRADARKLKRILVNLLSNGIKFTGAGGRVTLKAWCDGGHKFEVRDTGIGIAAKDIPRAFSHFGQVDSDLNRRYEGPGLGLPLANSLVKLHGGSLDLESEVGRGTRITVLLPADRVVKARTRGPYTGNGARPIPGPAVAPRCLTANRTSRPSAWREYKTRDSV